MLNKEKRKKWFDIIIDWEKSDLLPSVYCMQFNLNLKQFYRYRSLYIQMQSPKIEPALEAPTSLIPVILSPEKEIAPKLSFAKPQEPSVVEIKLPKLTINTNDKANVDFIYNLITRLTAC